MALTQSILATLKVSPDPAYNAARHGLALRRSRLMLIFLGGVYPAFYGLDLLVYGQHWREFGAIRLWHGLFSWALLAIDTRFGRQAVTHKLTMASTVTGSLGVAFMCAVTEGFSSNYMVGMILCFLGIATIEIFRPMGLMFALSGVSLGYCALNLILAEQIDSRNFVASMSYVAGAVMFCVTSAALTERQRRELFAANSRLLRQNAELERARRQQSQFLSTVSHELRSPVNSVLGFVELVEEREPALQEKSRANLRRVRESAHRLLRFINDLLDLAKAEAGCMEIHISQFDLAAVVSEVAEETRALVLRRDVAVEVRGPRSLMVTSDEMRVRQILTNLASNAAKFTERGAVTLSILEGNGVTLEVSDTGSGIPEEARGVIFEAFRQAGVTRGGTGLGLSIVRHLVQLLGGSIEFESELGRGTTFRARLGYIAARAAAA